jgi:hypothetical protein
MFGKKFLNEYYDKRPYENGILAHCKQCRYKHNDNGSPNDYQYLVNHLKERHPESYKIFDEKSSKYMEEGIFYLFFIE